MTTLFTYEANRSAWLFFVHIAAAFLFFGGVVTVVVTSLATGRARDVRAIALLARLASRVDALVVWPALVILVGAGAQLASAEDAYGHGWLRLGIVLTAVVAVVGVGVETWLNRRRLRLAERLLAGGDVSAADAARLSRSPMLVLVETLSLALLVVIFWLITAKPAA